MHLCCHVLHRSSQNTAHSQIFGFRSDFLISLIPFFSTFFSQWQIILPLVHKLIKLSREAIFSYCINYLAPQIHFRFFPVSSSFDAKVTSQIFQISYLVSTTYLNCKLKGREIDCFNMQGPLGSFNGHTPLWRPFFFGGSCDWLFQWRAEG